jgi:hypothetical protein
MPLLMVGQPLALEEFEVARLVEGDLAPPPRRSRPVSRIASTTWSAASGVDPVGPLAGQAEQDGAVGGVALAGQSERSVELGLDPLGPLEQRLLRRSASTKRQAAVIGPIVCELDGPTPILKRSKTLVTKQVSPDAAADGPRRASGKPGAPFVLLDDSTGRPRGSTAAGGDRSRRGDPERGRGLRSSGLRGRHGRRLPRLRGRPCARAEAGAAGARAGRGRSALALVRPVRRVGGRSIPPALLPIPAGAWAGRPRPLIEREANTRRRSPGARAYPRRRHLSGQSHLPGRGRDGRASARPLRRDPARGRAGHGASSSPASIGCSPSRRSCSSRWRRGG